MICLNSIVVENTAAGDILAVITNDMITNASSIIAVRMRPTYPESTSDQDGNGENNHNCNDLAKDCHTPIVRSILSLLTNPAFFFGCLSGGLLALCPWPEGRQTCRSYLALAKDLFFTNKLLFAASAPIPGGSVVFDNVANLD